MSTVFPIVVGSLIVIGTIMLYQAYQGLFSSFVMLVLTTISAAIAWNYCEPLGWSLGKWHHNHLFFVLLFGGLVTLGGLAKSIMLNHRYVKIAAAVASVAFLIVVASRAQMSPDTPTGNSYGQALALVGLFVITLLSLRAVADNVVTGNMTFPWQIERLGGATLGFFTGIIIVGVVLIAWQMMPFSPGLLAGGYQDFYGLTPTLEDRPADTPESVWKRMARVSQINLAVSPPAQDSWASYNRYDEKMRLQAAPFPYADGFASGLVKALSNGSIGSGQSFAQVHRDLLLELWANRNGINFMSRQAAPGTAISLAQWRPSQEDNSQVSSNKVRGILSLTLDYDARDEDKGGGHLRFKGTQIRLVGKSGQSYWPVAIYLDGISWPVLYGDLDTLALPEPERSRGYLQCKGYGEGNFLWAKDQQDQTSIRREIRIYREGEGLWFQMQLLGPSGNLELLPTSLGVVRSLKSNEKATISLIFEINRMFNVDEEEKEEKPDYVVFKRTAMKEVKEVEVGPVEKQISPAPATAPEKVSKTGVSP